jgi:hypothetical protein
MLLQQAQAQTINTVPYHAGVTPTQNDFNNFILMSEVNRGMTKITGINVANQTVELSPTERWPAGTWLRGFYTGSNVNVPPVGNIRSAPDFVSVPAPTVTFDGFTLAGYTGSHPLARMTSKMVRAHIHTDHLLPSGSGVNLAKIRDGIDYLIAAQVVSTAPRENGGYITWWVRPSQSTPNTDDIIRQNTTHAYETSHALRTMSEAYLYFQNYNISYTNMTGLYNAIVSGADNLYRKDIETAGDLGNSNYKGFAAWALAGAYKATKDPRYLCKAISLSQQIMDDQYTGGGRKDGMWLTGGDVPDADGCGHIAAHDSFINYHVIILRGLIETLDITPTTPDYASWKISLISSIKKGVNHLINYRVAFTNQGAIETGMLRNTAVDINGDETCAQWGYYFYEDVLEPIALLAQYSKFHWYFSKAEQTSLKNLLRTMSNGIASPNDPIAYDAAYIGYFTQYAYYADYLDALGKQTRIFGDDEHDCPPDFNLLFSTPHLTNAFAQAKNTIRSSATMGSGVEITYAPGHEIILDSGFTALEGSDLRAFIYPCGVNPPGPCSPPEENSARYGGKTELVSPAGKEQSESDADLSIYPNPFNQILTIDYEVKRSGNVTVSIYDNINREVAVLAEGVHENGLHTITFDGSKLERGVYYCVVRTNGFRQTKKIVLTK